MSIYSSLIASALFATATVSWQDCPLLGPVFPAPTNLLNSPTFQNATSALQTALDDGFSMGQLDATNTSISIQVFSTHDENPLFEFHHTATTLLNSTVEVNKVDSNSIYRTGSAGKVYTVYLFLLENGFHYWNEPVTKYVPELAAVAHKAKEDPIANVDWELVTLGMLASQMSDIAKDCKFLS